MVENSCWQAILQSDVFLNWDKKEQEYLLNLFRYEGSAEDISLSDVFPPNSDGQSIAPEFLSSPIGTSEYVDKRIRTLRFYNFRLFNTPTDEIPYGVDFTRKGKVCSAFFVGSNGTGKSSVYSALELHYTGFCSHAKEMGCDIQDYLTYGLNKLSTIQAKDVSIGVSRQDSKDTIHQSLESISPICPSSPFCSDYDVEQIRQNGKTLYLYLLRQLGYGMFERLLQLISSLQSAIEKIEKVVQPNQEELTSTEFGIIVLNYFEFARQAQKRMNECDTYSKADAIRNKIESGQTRHMPKLFKDQWAIAKKSRSTTTGSSTAGLVLKQSSKDTTVYNKQVKTLATLYREIKKIYEQADELRGLPSYKDESSLLLTMAKKLLEKKQELENKDFQYVANEASQKGIEYKKGMLEKSRSLILDLQHQTVLQFSQIFQQEFSDIMSEFSDLGETFHLDVKSDSINLNIQVPIANGINEQDATSQDSFFPATPNEYLNSFRFKLFCITLKVALAFFWMQKNKTVVPFVIDDVFNANDFNNGLKLESFVCRIFRWYRQKLCADGQCKIPFQLIMFTHDDMMQTAFKKGFIRSMAIDSKEQMLEPAAVNYQLICTRLFPKHSVEDVTKGEYKEYKNLYLHVSKEM